MNESPEAGDRIDMKTALLCWGISLVLMGSWLLPWTRAYWDSLDVATFLRLNGSLKSSPEWQRTMAFVNSGMFDKIGVVCFLLLALAFGLFCAPEYRAARISRLLAFGLFFVVFWTLLTLALVYVIPIDRLSPSLDPRTSHHTINLRVLVPDLKCKIDSTDCFPGDHALGSTAMLFYLVSRRAWGWATATFALTVFFCTPRLIGGAHWISDILVGGVSFSLFALGLYRALPFRAPVVRVFERLAGAILSRLRLGATDTGQGGK